jgi:hypothetical protein
MHILFEQKIKTFNYICTLELTVIENIKAYFFVSLTLEQARKFRPSFRGTLNVNV